MKGIVKAVIAGCIIIGIGVAILLLALGLNGWTFTPNYQMTTYSTEDEEITTPVDTVKLNFKAGKIKTEFYDGEFITVKYPKIENYNTDIEVADGVLSFTGPNKLHWYSFPLGWGNLPETVIKLPQNTTFNMDILVNAGTLNVASGDYGTVKIVLNAGSVTWENDATCEALDCTVNAGSAKYEKIDCSGTCKINVNAGSITVNDLTCAQIDTEVNAGSLNVKKLTCDQITSEINAGSIILKINGRKTDYTITVDKSAGSCNIEAQTSASDKTISIDVSAGSVDVTFLG